MDIVKRIAKLVSSWGEMARVVPFSLFSPHPRKQSFFQRSSSEDGNELKQST
jgi:hypothetical protein